MGGRVYDKVCGTWGGNEDRDTLRKHPNPTAREGSRAQRPSPCLGGHPAFLQCSSSLSGSSRRIVRTHVYMHTRVHTWGPIIDNFQVPRPLSSSSASEAGEAKPAPHLSQMVPSPLLQPEGGKDQNRLLLVK